MPDVQHMILTGAASGIGRHLTGLLARAGHELLATDLNFTALERAAIDDSWPAQRVRLRGQDVRDADTWKAVIAEASGAWPTIDVLLNVAGLVRPGWVHELTAEDVSLHLDVNARGVMLGTQAAAAHMVRQRHGHIVNIASMAGIAPVPGLALYTASKFAVRGFSLAVAQELRPHGVYVTVVCPDAVVTPMYDLQVDYPQAALTFSGSRPLTVDDVGRAIVDRVLTRKPMELILPKSRGWTAKLVSLMPGLAFRVAPRLARRGRQVQERLKGSR